MNELKKLFNEYKAAKEEATKADNAYENDPENEELENQFDIAYKNEFNVLEKLSIKIQEVTKNQIDKITARKLIITNLNGLEKLILKLN